MIETNTEKIVTLRRMAATLCESIGCDSCPVTIYNYEKRSESDKVVGHIPCCENLYRWMVECASEEGV